MASLDKIKRRLGITDDLQDQLLNDLIDDSKNAFRALTGATMVDDRYTYMIESVVYKLYNRKGSEGITKETVDGYQADYASGLFDEFMPILERDFNLSGKDHRKRGRFKFI